MVHRLGEKLAVAVLLYIFNIGFPVSIFLPYEGSLKKNPGVELHNVGNMGTSYVKIPHTGDIESLDRCGL